jgi:hypothetical protein
MPPISFARLIVRYNAGMLTDVYEGQLVTHHIDHLGQLLIETMRFEQETGRVAMIRSTIYHPGDWELSIEE